MSDSPETLDALVNARRYCPHCGHANRLTAHVCVNCGLALPPISEAPPEAPTVSIASPAKPAKRAKRCPDCGTICKLEAKVCPNCGHHFQTDFSQPIPVTPQPVTQPAIGEAPFVQMPSVGIAPPVDPPQVVQLPPISSAPTPKPPPAKVDKSDAPAPVADVVRNKPEDKPASIPPTAADDSTDGEPAPDVTDVDLTALRQRNNDSFSNRFNRNGLFKKDNS